VTEGTHRGSSLGSGRPSSGSRIGFVRGAAIGCSPERRPSPYLKGTVTRRRSGRSMCVRRSIHVTPGSAGGRVALVSAPSASWVRRRFRRVRAASRARFAAMARASRAPASWAGGRLWRGTATGLLRAPLTRRSSAGWTFGRSGPAQPPSADSDECAGSPGCQQSRCYGGEDRS